MAVLDVVTSRIGNNNKISAFHPHLQILQQYTEMRNLLAQESVHW
jgi:hypothetical protein